MNFEEIKSAFYARCEEIEAKEWNSFMSIHQVQELLWEEKLPFEIKEHKRHGIIEYFYVLAYGQKYLLSGEWRADYKHGMHYMVHKLLIKDMIQKIAWS